MESMNNQATASQSFIVSSLYVLVCLFLFVDKYQFGVCNYIMEGFLKKQNLTDVYSVFGSITQPQIV